MEVPRHWRLKKQRYALVGETCPSCKAHVFPPRPVCPYCGGVKQPEMAQEPAMVLAERMETVSR